MSVCRLSCCRLLVVTFGMFLLAACSSSESLKETPTHSNSNDPYPVFPEDSTNHEGMWLLPQIQEKAYPMMETNGFALSPNEIYHPDSTSLNRAVVRINNGDQLAGSGSFVSPEGLILTNYNAVYSAITSTSTNEKNYLKEGFYADSMPSEIPLKNYRLYITVEQKEVTEKIKNRLADSLTYRKRKQQTQQIKKKLIAERKGDHKNLAVTINDFWGGNRHFMSVYRIIQDVRLVHVPPSAIGNVGGHLHNWEWPRHSGDYAFLRAYVAPNGNSRSYSPSNVPFNPARHINIEAGGINRGDFTTTLGFPGQTSRHKSSYALKFYRDQQIPIIIDSYKAILDGLQYAAEQDSQAALDNAAQRASIAHTLTYYKNALKQFKQHGIVEKTRRAENKFEEWVKQDSMRNIRYRRVLPQLDQAYNIAGQTGDLLYATIYTLNNNRLLEIADLYHSYRQVIADSSQQDIRRAYKDSLLKQHKQLLSDINIEAQQIMLSQMLQMLSTLPEGKVMFYLLDLFGDTQGDSLKHQIDQYLDRQERESIVYNLDRAKAFMNLPVDSARAKPLDNFIDLYRSLIENYQFSRKNYVQHIPYRNPAQELYVEGMRKFRPDTMQYADANGTLRLTTGTVTGYQPRDGMYYLPFTTFNGLVMCNGDSPSDFPKSLISRKDSTQYATYRNQVPANFLTSNDITGGNTGGPVLNNKGKLVGITFNSNLQAVSSDYYYNPSTKRALNVDIRYILFLMDIFADDQRLAKEMNIQP